jgi:EmrB/QacA subfamily drug resistance transporter
MTARPPPRWVVLTFLCAGVFLGAVDFYIVSVAIPDLLRSFPGTGITGISWVINGYTVTFTAALLPAGGLADRYGRRRVFLGGLVVFTGSALACAFAPSAGVLIAARVVQGAGGGTITPLALTLILPRFGEQRRGTAIGLWTATQASAVAAGPAIGGALVSAIGWRAVFWLQLPVGLIALGGTAWALRGDPAGPAGPEESQAARGQLPDLVGVGLLGAATGLFSLGVVQAGAWGVLSWRTDLALIAGIGLGVMFVLRTLRHPAPIIDLRLLRIRLLRRANIAMLLTGLVMYAVPFGLVLFLIGVWHYSAARAGLAVTPGPIVQAVTALVAGRLVNRFGAQAAALPGAVLLAASPLIFTLGAGTQHRYLAVVLPTVITSSLAIGLLITPLSSVIVSQVPAAKLGSGTAMSVTARAVGAVISLSAFALLLGSVRGGQQAPGAYRIAWAAMTVIALAAIVVVSLTRPRRPRPSVTGPSVTGPSVTASPNCSE